MRGVTRSHSTCFSSLACACMWRATPFSCHDALPVPFPNSSAPKYSETAAVAELKLTCRSVQLCPIRCEYTERNLKNLINFYFSRLGMRQIAPWCLTTWQRRWQISNLGRPMPRCTRTHETLPQSVKLVGPAPTSSHCVKWLVCPHRHLPCAVICGEDGG